MKNTYYFFFLTLILACSEKRKFSGNTNDLFVPSGLEATLWAASPMLNNPTNMDVDYKGRIWITEAVNYRNYRNNDSFFLHHPKGDRIVILEDTDHDGTADTSKVFVQDTSLISPIGIAVLGNKVFVSCSPNLIVYTDENGDDVPDKKEIFLTGFGGKDHDHSLHAVYGGPDGNLYFNTGNAGPHIVTDKGGWTLRSGSMYTGGSPYNEVNHGNMTSDDKKIWTGGLAIRIDPNGKNLKVMAHNFRNSYEVIPDSYGNLWQNDNDDEVLACRTSWLMEGGNAGYFSEDGTRNWKADQRPGQEIPVAHWHQDDPGAMPSGDITGAGAPTGITVIESNDLGEEYRGMLLSADAGRNIIFGYHPHISHSGYDLGKRKKFISSLDNSNEEYVWNDSTLKLQKNKWFRPSDVTIGTDGAIYVADWYDPVVGGHLMQDSTGFGRIYRIARKDKKMDAPQIDLNTTEGQLLALKSPAINVRYAGFERLKTKGDAVLEPLKELLKDENTYVRARAVWLLSQSGDAGRGEVENLLSDKNEIIRATAYRALRIVTEDAVRYADKMVADTSAFVRREIAVSLTDIPYEKKKELLLRLALQNNDRWMLETIGRSAHGNESLLYAQLKNAMKQNMPATKWNEKMSMLAWRLHPAETVNDFGWRALDSTLPVKDRKDALTALGFIKNKEAIKKIKLTAFKSTGEVAETAKFWLLLLSPESAKEFASPTIKISALAGNNTYDLNTIMKIKPDISKGEQLFTANCRTCHKAGKEGSTVAPDLTFITKKFGDRELLDAIIHPSASIAFGYEPWMINTKDKKSYFGFVIADNDQSMTIRDISGNNHMIKKSVIISAKKQDKSLMPEPSQLGLTQQDLANIVGFLKVVK
ncbi:MAG TPA: PVC-type heme-binding CxxCH protein [Flavitalea sp.]|nr:PVC-type heme-binding CxxCH protein [Flavitalea sp.]